MTFYYTIQTPMSVLWTSMTAVMMHSALTRREALNATARQATQGMEWTAKVMGCFNRHRKQVVKLSV